VRKWFILYGHEGGLENPLTLLVEAIEESETSNLSYFCNENNAYDYLF
jgi:hypothetical protein